MMPMETELTEDLYRKQRYLGLLHRSWRICGVAVMGFVHVWLLCMWLLQVFIHPGFLLGFGIAYSLVVGFALGLGSLNGEGDEMLFCLPVTRRSLFWIQAAAGGIPLLLMNGLGILALYAEAPQTVWGLFVRSGFTEPFPEVLSGHLWGWAVCVPLLLYAGIYTLASRQVTLRSTFFSLFGAMMVSGVTLLLGVLVENLFWEEIHGPLSSLLLLLVTTLTLWWGAEGYKRKEASPNEDSPGRNATTVLILVIIGILLVLFLMLMWVSPSTPVEIRSDPNSSPDMPVGPSSMSTIPAGDTP